jgi:hypothetical protein
MEDRHSTSATSRSFPAQSLCSGGGLWNRCARVGWMSMLSIGLGSIQIKSNPRTAFNVVLVETLVV